MIEILIGLTVSLDDLQNAGVEDDHVADYIQSNYPELSEEDIERLF